jgi:hypothetical protein
MNARSHLFQGLAARQLTFFVAVHESGNGPKGKSLMSAATSAFRAIVLQNVVALPGGLFFAPLLRCSVED